ncbi:MAG: Exoglucanase B precursor [candidate division WS2 bacterium ADurb.Bin280]|uniref:Exoglucanase B n=1 Tax=candidate division WS2 bacterium ADurb.Bin280 TaxID=1852829 RepID=A0A1V5SFD8_9BACT|nr:MAG: Exoglucanase B precursor [candidate division WS2 bacterium ADurb.Bin280]
MVDLDEDGDQDIIAAADVSHRVYWYSNDGSENFSKIDLLGYVRNANHCMPIDMDNDGDIDILGGGGHSDTGTRWYENNGSESFISHALKYSVYGAGKPSPADIDNDGDLDVVGKFVYSTNIHSLYLWKNNGTGIFNKATQIFENQNGFSAYIGAGGYVQVLLSDAGQDQCKLTSATAIDDDVMHQLTLTWNATDLKIYIDGVLDASTTCSGVGSLSNTNYPTIGRGSDAIFDEFRLSSSLSDQDNITLGYNNQNTPSSFISVDTEVKGDQTDPENPETFTAYDSSGKNSELESENWYGHDNPYFEWGAGSDTQAGVAGYFVYFGTTIDANPVTVGAYQTGTSFTSSTTLTSGASHYLRIVTRDNAGNDSEPVTKFIYNYDGTAPEPPIYINVSPAGCSTQSTFTFTWDAATDTGGSQFSHYEYKKGSTGSIVNIGNVLTQSATPYQEGDNIFYIRSVDNAGNISSWQTAVFCATAVVSIVDGPSVVVGPSSMNVSWTSSKQTTGYVKVYQENTYVSEQGHTQYTQSHSVKVVGLEPEKTYRYQLVWTDSGGNLGESDWYTTTTSSAPSVKNFSVQLINPSTVIASWATSEASTASLQYGESAVSDNTIDIAGSATSFSKELSSLKGGTAYQIRVVARSSDDYPFYYTTSFTTPPLPLIESLEFESDTSQASPSLNVSWETNVDTTSTIFYREKGSSSYKETSSSDKARNHKITISNLADSTTYEVYAQGIDDYGNTARSTVNTVDTPYDSRPPTISDVVIEASNVGVGKENDAQIAVSWKTDEPSSSKVEFGEGVSGEDYTQSTTEDPTQTNSHLVIVSGLKDSTPYHLRVCSKDKGDNQTCSDDSTVIPGEVQKSILSLILNTLQKAFGWLENII